MKFPRCCFIEILLGRIAYANEAMASEAAPAVADAVHLCLNRRATTQGHGGIDTPVDKLSIKVRGSTQCGRVASRQLRSSQALCSDVHERWSIAT